MTDVLLYLVAANLALILGVLVIRHRSRSLHTQALAALLASTLLLLATGRTEGPLALVPVWLACLFLLGPALLAWGFRLASRARRYRLASLLARALDLALLRRGDGTAETLRGIALARAGKESAHLGELQKRLAVSTPHSPEACALQRRILLVLAAAGRHAEVVELFSGPSPQHPKPWEPLGAALVRSLAELGRWQEAAGAMELLERGPAGQDLQVRGWLDQARLVILAGAGRRALLEELLPPRGGFAEEVPSDQVALWAARARAHEDAPPLLGCAPDFLELVASRARQSAALPRSLSWGPSIAPVTTLLVLANLGLFVLSELLGGSTSPLVLHRLGALFSWPLVLEEPWRLVSYFFLHFGPAHLIVNLLALWLFGRLAEQAFGPWRFFAVYCSGGLIGGLLSLLLGGPGFRVGASGAVLGVVGGATVLFRARGAPWPQAWRRTMFGGLLATLIGSVGIGLFFHEVDNLAHLGGALGGMAVAWLLGRRVAHGAEASRGRERAGAAAAALAALALAAWVVPAVVRFDPAEGAWKKIEAGGIRLEVPLWWASPEARRGRALESPAEDAEESPVIRLWRLPRVLPLPEGAPWPAPAPWRGIRQTATLEGRPAVRLVFRRALADGEIQAEFLLPGPGPHAEARLLDRLLRSIALAGD